ENIKNLCSELHLPLLAKEGSIRVLINRQVDVRQIGSAQYVSSRVPQSSGRLQRKHRRIEPPVEIACYHLVRIERRCKIGTSRDISVVLQCPVDAQDRINRKARLIADDAREPPAMEYL